MSSVNRFFFAFFFGHVHGSAPFRLRLQAGIQLHRLYQVIQMERTNTLRRIQKEAAEVNGGDFNDR